MIIVCITKRNQNTGGNLKANKWKVKKNNIPIQWNIMQLLLVSSFPAPYLYIENSKFIGLLQEIAHTSWLKMEKKIETI